ncbi:MAG: molecular chaperone DnaJ [Candidatus Pelagibacterales bacterium]|nr:MAG: molecular chaperone DnaJ [Pelagibacterales bacterium]
MNLVFFGIVIFILIFVLLSWFAKTSSKKIAKGVRVVIFILSVILATIFVIAGRFLFSLPLLFLAMSVLKIKGLTAIQILQLWRLLQYLKNSGRFSYYGRSSNVQPSSSLSLEEAYKILGLKKGCSKNDVIKATNKLQKKIHPDVNPNANTERLSQIINEAKENILKNDFN